MSADDQAPSSEWPTIVPLSWTKPAELFIREPRFTAWLAERVDVLEAALGLEGIQVVSTEFDVEGKRLDILAAAIDPEEGGSIGLAIEAQYRRSDHDHLGKLLTYAAGAAAIYSRVLCVWLVDEVEPAHLAAVDLLNLETSDRLGFVLARVRFLKSGASEWYYDVDVVRRPNVFIRAQQERVQPAANADKREFLVKVRDLARPPLLDAGFSRVAGPGKEGYSFWVYWPNKAPWFIDVRAGDADSGFVTYLYVNGETSTEANELILARIATHRDVVDQAVARFDGIVDWSAHKSSSRAKTAALARCDWPGIGYGAEPQEAAERLIAFGRGVASAVHAAETPQQGTAPSSATGQPMDEEQPTTSP